MKSVLAIVAHPDDIEFTMAGTMILLRQHGWNLHYLNISNGCVGSMITNREDTARIRSAEARAAAAELQATYYEPITDDMGIFYQETALADVARVVRLANPSIVLTHSPSDYMIDHENACRLAVSATFVKNMPNFRATGATPPGKGDVAIYHAQPHSNFDPLGRRVAPTHKVDFGSVLEQKVKALDCHRSQFEWLDVTQGMASLADTMKQAARLVTGPIPSDRLFEGFRQHNPTGFSAKGFDPLRDALGDLVEVELGDFMK